jgi:DNA replication and repair protein RecF
MQRPFLSKLTLQSFRCYSHKPFEFDPAVTVLVGPNAAGKTSVLEAINLLATGNSFRAGSVEEMITFEADLGRVKGELVSETPDNSDNDIETTQLEVILTRGQVQGKKTQARLYSVNDIRRQKRVFTTHFSTVVFRPEDMRLIEGSPTRRREYLDSVLGQVDQHYDHALTQYTQILRRRNRVLEQIRERQVPPQTLHYWTQGLLKYGVLLQEQRQKLLQFCNGVSFPMPFAVEYVPSVLSEERLEQYATKEVAAGHTLIGPHKDDISVTLLDKRRTEPFAVALYGSRGQQRLGVLWLKMAALHFLEEQQERRPLLLLDDIMSELDDEHQELVTGLMKTYQTVLATTEAEWERLGTVYALE